MPLLRFRGVAEVLGQMLSNVFGDDLHVRDGHANTSKYRLTKCVWFKIVSHYDMI